MEITTIGLDLAKRVFQVHGVNAEGAGVLRKALRRGQVLPFFAGVDPWHRSCGRHGAGRVCCRSEAIPFGARVCRLAWADALAELQRGQGPAWPHLQDGRPVSAQAPCRRRDRAGPAGEAQAADGGPTPPRSACQKAGAGGERGDGEQDGACRLGHHGPRGDLPAPSCAGAGGMSRRAS